MNYFQFNLGDYARDTSHLTLLEDAVYMRLLRRYYADEAPLSDNLSLLCRLVSARTDEERDAVGRVLGDFFVLAHDGWHHPRADRELAKYRERVSVNQRNGRNGGRPRAETQSVPSGFPAETHRQPIGNPMATLTNNQEPTTNTSLPPTGERRTAERFADFWAAWPAGERKQDRKKCEELWRRQGLDRHADAILADVALKRSGRKWSDGYIEAPLVYLRGARWQDQAQAEAPGWWCSQSGIRARGDELRVPYDDDRASGVPWLRYVADVWLAAGDGPWWDESSSVYPIARERRDAAPGGALGAHLARISAELTT